MAYYNRGFTSPRDEPQALYANPLSPQRNPNRLSGGMPNANSAARGGLTRRFTTTEVSTLTPIGQQRKQAAGDYSVSTCAHRLKSVHQRQRQRWRRAGRRGFRIDMSPVNCTWSRDMWRHVNGKTVELDRALLSQAEGAGSRSDEEQLCCVVRRLISSHWVIARVDKDAVVHLLSAERAGPRLCDAVFASELS
jgi:hypothetical protein